MHTPLYDGYKSKDFLLEPRSFFNNSDHCQADINLKARNWCEFVAACTANVQILSKITMTGKD